MANDKPPKTLSSNFDFGTTPKTLPKDFEFSGRQKDNTEKKKDTSQPSQGQQRQPSSLDGLQSGRQRSTVTPTTDHQFLNAPITEGGETKPLIPAPFTQQETLDYWNNRAKEIPNLEKQLELAKLEGRDRETGVYVNNNVYTIQDQISQIQQTRYDALKSFYAKEESEINQLRKELGQMEKEYEQYLYKNMTIQSKEESSKSQIIGNEKKAAIQSKKQEITDLEKGARNQFNDNIKGISAAIDTFDALIENVGLLGQTEPTVFRDMMTFGKPVTHSVMDSPLTPSQRRIVENNNKIKENLKELGIDESLINNIPELINELDSDFAKRQATQAALEESIYFQYTTPSEFMKRQFESTMYNLIGGVGNYLYLNALKSPTASNMVAGTLGESVYSWSQSQSKTANDYIMPVVNQMPDFHIGQLFQKDYYTMHGGSLAASGLFFGTIGTLSALTGGAAMAAIGAKGLSATIGTGLIASTVTTPVMSASYAHNTFEQVYNETGDFNKAAESAHKTFLTVLPTSFILNTLSLGASFGTGSLTKGITGSLSKGLTNVGVKSTSLAWSGLDNYWQEWVTYKYISEAMGKDVIGLADWWKTPTGLQHIVNGSLLGVQNSVVGSVTGFMKDGRMGNVNQSAYKEYSQGYLLAKYSKMGLENGKKELEVVISNNLEAGKIPQQQANNLYQMHEKLSQDSQFKELDGEAAVVYANTEMKRSVFQQQEGQSNSIMVKADNELKSVQEQLYAHQMANPNLKFDRGEGGIIIPIVNNTQVKPESLNPTQKSFYDFMVQTTDGITKGLQQVHPQTYHMEVDGDMRTFDTANELFDALGEARTNNPDAQIKIMIEADPQTAIKIAEDAVNNKIITQGEADVFIEAQQKELGLPTTAELFVSEETQNTLDKFVMGEPVTNEDIQKASDNLYDNYKRLEGMKSSTQRTLTIQQINNEQQLLGEVIDRLENIKEAQKESGEFVNEQEFVTNKLADDNIIIQKPQEQKELSETAVEESMVKQPTTNETTTTQEAPTETTEVKLSDTKKIEEANKKIAEGIDVLADFFDVRKKLTGEEGVGGKDAFKALLDIIDGLITKGVVSSKNIINDLKAFINNNNPELAESINTLIDENTEAINEIYKPETTKKTKEQKEIDKKVEGKPKGEKKVTNTWVEFKRDLAELEKVSRAAVKAGALTEVESFNDFISGIRKIVENAEDSGELNASDTQSILRHIENPQQYKTQKKRNEVRQKVMLEIENTVNLNIAETQKNRLLPKIEKSIKPKEKRVQGREQGRTIDEWDFKTDANTMAESDIDLGAMFDQAQAVVMSETDPQAVEDATMEMLMAGYADVVRKFNAIKEAFDQMTLAEKQYAVYDLMEINEYVGGINQAFLEIYKQKVREKAEFNNRTSQDLITSMKRKKAVDGTDLLGLAFSEEGGLGHATKIQFILENTDDSNIIKKINSRRHKLLRMGDVEFREAMERIVGAKIPVSAKEYTQQWQKTGHAFKKFDNLEGIWQTVFGRHSKEQYDKVKFIIDDIDKAAREHERLSDWSIGLQKRFLQSLDPKIKNTLYDESSELGIVIIDKDGRERPEFYQMNYDQVIKIATDLNNEIIFGDYANTYGHTAATILQDHVNQIILDNPTLIDAIAAMQEYYDGWYDRANVVYRRKYNRDMPRQGYYTPKSVVNRISDSLTDLITPEGTSQYSNIYVTTRYTKSRRGGGDVDVSKGALHTMETYGKSMADFVAFAEAKDNFVYFIKRPDVQRGISEFRDAKTLNDIFRTYMNNIPRTDTEYGKTILDGLIRNIVLGPLSLNITMLPKQAASFNNFVTDMMYEQMWKNLPLVTGAYYFKELSNPNGWGEYFQEVMKSPFIRMRMRRGFDRDFQLFAESRIIPALSSKSGFGRAVNVISKFLETEVKTGSIKYGDIAAFLGGKPLYFQLKDRIAKENPNLTQEELRRRASDGTVTMGEKKQQSQWAHNLSYFQLSGKHNTLFPYMTTKMQYTQQVMSGLRGMDRYMRFGEGTPQEFANNFRRVVHYGLVANWQFALIALATGKMLWGYEDREQKDVSTMNTVVGGALEWGGMAVGGVPILGDAMQMTGRKLQGKDTYSATFSATADRMNTLYARSIELYDLMVVDGKSYDELSDSKKRLFNQTVALAIEGLTGYGANNVRKMYNRLKYGTPEKYQYKKRK